MVPTEIYIAGGILLVAIIIYVILRLGRFKRLRLEKVTLANPKIYEGFYRYAADEVDAEYEEAGKPVLTQKGELRANYSNDVTARIAKITAICCEDDYMSRDFIDYKNRFFPRAVVRDLPLVIGEYLKYRDVEVHENFESFLQECDSMTPEEFFDLKELQKGDMVGVYVIHNETRDMYYVGQAKRLFFRINQHFTGHGNGDVYADYKYGDDFSIRIVKLSESGYSDLDKLERDLIREYDAYESGYNKTV